MTVSRVINDDRNVRPVKRELVHAAIRDLNYQPNPAARILAGGELIRLALLYANPSAAYLSEFLVGSLDQASRSNIQLVVEQVDGDSDAIATRLAVSTVDGVILPPPLCDFDPLVRHLVSSGTPIVAVASGRAPAGASAVRIDDFAAARAMTRHILSLGHSRIGFIKGNPNQSASEERMNGYAAGLHEAGIMPNDALVEQGLFTYKSGLDAAERLLALATPPTAIFASNDDMAAAVIAVAHRRQLNVPDDLTVCGFDDTAIATTIWPALTTIRQPIAEMSRRAVALLADEIRRRRAGEPTEHRCLLLDFTLLYRESDARPSPC